MSEFMRGCPSFSGTGRAPERPKASVYLILLLTALTGSELLLLKTACAVLQAEEMGGARKASPGGSTVHNTARRATSEALSCCIVDEVPALAEQDPQTCFEVPLAW